MNHLQMCYYEHSTLQLKLRIYLSYTQPLLTYNMGTWTMTKALETFLVLLVLHSLS